MRRAAALTAILVASLWFASPAQAFAHNAVHDPVMHTVLDALTVVAVSAPVWTVLLWGRANRWWLAALVAVVQLPVAVIGFVPIANPAIHLALFLVALALTAVSLRIVRVQARSAAAQPLPTPGLRPR